MNGLLDLRGRLAKADGTLIDDARSARRSLDREEARRLEAKAEGVRLAISYVDDALRIQHGSAEA